MLTIVSSRGSFRVQILCAAFSGSQRLRELGSFFVILYVPYTLTSSSSSAASYCRWTSTASHACRPPACCRSGPFPCGVIEIQCASHPETSTENHYVLHRVSIAPIVCWQCPSNTRRSIRVLQDHTCASRRKSGIDHSVTSSAKQHNPGP